MIADMAATSEQGPIEAAASRFLRSTHLCERAARVCVLAEWIAGFSELRDVPCDRRAVRAAVWFQDAWCCEDLHAGRISAPLVVAMQPNDVQRERAADAAARQLKEVVDDTTRATAAQAIREAGMRETHMPEAQIVGEATNLDSIGPLGLWGQIARCAAEDRPVASVVSVWERQIEYQYWAGRITETLRFERSRGLARHRCAVMDDYFVALRDQLTGGDRHVVPEAQD